MGTRVGLRTSYLHIMSYALLLLPLGLCIGSAVVCGQQGQNGLMILSIYSASVIVICLVLAVFATSRIFHCAPKNQTKPVDSVPLGPVVIDGVLWSDKEAEDFADFANLTHTMLTDASSVVYAGLCRWKRIAEPRRHDDVPSVCARTDHSQDNVHSDCWCGTDAGAV